MINGIPEKGNAMILEEVKKLGLKLGFPNPMEDVLWVKRLVSSQTPRPIIVRLVNRTVRAKWVHFYRQKQLWKENIFMCEYLPKPVLDLLLKAKAWALKMKYKSVWTWNNHIWFQKNDSTPREKILDLEHLKYLIKTAAIQELDGESETERKKLLNVKLLKERQERIQKELQRRDKLPRKIKRKGGFYNTSGMGQKKQKKERAENDNKNEKKERDEEKKNESEKKERDEKENESEKKVRDEKKYESEKKVRDEEKNKNEKKVRDKKKNENEKKARGKKKNENEKKVRGKKKNENEKKVRGKKKNESEKKVRGKKKNENEKKERDEKENESEKKERDEKESDNETKERYGVENENEISSRRKRSPTNKKTNINEKERTEGKEKEKEKIEEFEKILKAVRKEQKENVTETVLTASEEENFKQMNWTKF
ncbi:hypothetical protein WDU94_005708 [Cyamophila willieti]